MTGYSRAILCAFCDSASILKSPVVTYWFLLWLEFCPLKSGKGCNQPFEAQWGHDVTGQDVISWLNYTIITAESGGFDSSRECQVIHQGNCKTSLAAAW